MVKTTAVLFLAMATLLALDAWRFQRNATAAAAALSAMMAENIRVAIKMDDALGVKRTLETARFQSSVERTCAYDARGQLYSTYVRERLADCPPTAPASVQWSELAATWPVEQNGEKVGSVYTELAWTSMWARLLTAGIASLAVLALAAGVMLVVSNRLHRRISGPIMQLAGAAKQLGKTESFDLPPIEAPPDEVGDLVRAFGAMVSRVKTANQSLTASNDALRREIEERRQIERDREALLTREREANRVKDEFLATVSHELRTPLNAIVGWSRILVTAKPDPETMAKAAASLHRNALSQARVIDDLIDISRIATGKLRMMAEPLDLRTVVEGAIESIRPAAMHAGINVTVDMPPVPCVITGDRERLEHVVWNLLSNAVKFAPHGQVTVALKRSDETFELVVADNGVGIAPEFIGQVFDRFRQADASTTREQGGLGIGLAIVKELVELHGGSIQVESGGRGKGARFFVVLPAVSAHVPAEYVPAQPVEDRVSSLAGLSILAVDANLDALELLEVALTRAGARVRVASSGDDALALWEREPADVLLCDLAIPGMSGFDLLTKIRDWDRGSGRATRAIAVTALATEEQVAKTVEAGFQSHVVKSFDPNRLIRVVRMACPRGREG